ncbi:MAG: hypothetical protein ABL879_19865 [Devosia sp.]
MIDIKNLAATSKRFGKAMSPLLVGVLLAGCNAATPVKTDGDGMMESSSSSSVDAMMESSSSSSLEGAMESSEAAMNGSYKNGTYASAGVYRSPAGAESVMVSVTLDGGKVTAATFKGDATHKVSIKLQTAFSEGFQEQVVGKSIDEVSVGVVNGSSLTGIGFMDALEKIKAEAKA